MNDADLIEQLAIHEARSSFWAFRQYINPKMKAGWWQREIAAELQTFLDDMVQGKRPKLVIQAPPQHGKTVQVVEFIAWAAGINPDMRTIYTSFSEDLGVKANLKLQRIYDSEVYQKIFPATRISSSNVVTISGQSMRNREMLEYVGRGGYFRNTTVRGRITGQSLDFGVVDDPIKGREEAGSVTVRNRTWNWFTDDFFTRFSEDAGMLAILTRWHVDDPIGRLIAADPDVKVLSYPALAIRNDPHRKIGEALFPELKSSEFILERKKTMPSTSFESLYQQNPQILGGEIIKGEWFPRASRPPKIKHRKIFADTAMKTGERNDYSVLECWGLGEDGKLYLLDLLRGKWEAPDLKRRVIEFWAKHNTEAMNATHGQLRQLVVEDKASGTGLIQDLKRNEQGRATIPIKGVGRTKDKLTRVLDVLSYIEAGHVVLLEDSPFLSDFVAECESFTADDSHIHDDQIDPMCDAIEDMLRVTGNSFFGRGRA